MSAHFWDNAKGQWVYVYINESNAPIALVAVAGEPFWSSSHPVEKTDLDYWSSFVTPRTFEDILELIPLI